MEIDRGLFNGVYFPYLREGRRYQIFFGGSSSNSDAMVIGSEPKSQACASCGEAKPL